MFDQVANIIARKSLASHANLIRLCKNDKEKLGQLRSKNGWSVLQFAIYKEDPECVQILASNMPELVNHVGNSVLPIQSAFNLHMRDDHTLQQRQIIHILIDLGAVGAFRALISRQYMCAPNYERDFIGWTIRTMLRLARQKSLSAVSVVNEAFRADIETIFEQQKRDVYKNEIKLIVKLGNKINSGLVFGTIVTDAENPVEVQSPVDVANEAILEEEEEYDVSVAEAAANIVDCDDSAVSHKAALGDVNETDNSVDKLLENVKEVGDALSNLVTSATKSEEVLNASESEEEEAPQQLNAQLEEAIDRNTLELSIDEINSTVIVEPAVEALAGGEVANHDDSREEELLSESLSSTAVEVDLSSDKVKEVEVPTEEPAPPSMIDEVSPLECDSTPALNTEVDECDQDVEPSSNQSDLTVEETTKDDVQGVFVAVENESEHLEVKTHVDLTEEAVIEIENGSTEATEENAATENVQEVKDDEVSTAEDVDEETAATETTVITEVTEETETNKNKETEEALVTESIEEIELTVTNDEVDLVVDDVSNIDTTTDSFVVVEQSIESVEDADYVEVEESVAEDECDADEALCTTPGENEGASEDINDEFNNDEGIPAHTANAPNVDVYQLEYTTDIVQSVDDDKSAHKMVLLKQAEDVIFSEGATTDGQDTGVETRRKWKLIES